MMPETETRRQLIENELLMLTNAGELPELARPPACTICRKRRMARISA